MAIISYLMISIIYGFIFWAFVSVADWKYGTHVANDCFWVAFIGTLIVIALVVVSGSDDND